jgi:hypothetical protein
LIKNVSPAGVARAAGSVQVAEYPDPDPFVVDRPMGRYTGVKEMIEMSMTAGEYKSRFRCNDID